ncbi:serine-rich adhesin for platelets [Octopus bimaculoides]|uniref:serine-rich adhesin for platelets n=1 Tax=Octopus bimaculoides TaxID=37653 RepID=UPI00071E2753|nr:serine-rich adhesin for platelets [Octopus bimaculoides]|eukprot:XP_014770931.1 PREDICTED: serine-rich adhesin for platelets-like [Octopus bimaculoides]
MEFTSWPHINLSSAPSSCPFDEWLNCVSATKPQPANKDNANVPVAWSAESGAPQNAANLTRNNNNNNNNNNTTKKCTLSQQVASQKVPGRRLVNWERRKLAEKKLRQGFCECCDVRFDDVKKHLNSTEHCAFRKNEANYKQLDKLIDHGRAIHQFVENVVSEMVSSSDDNSERDYEFSESTDKVMLLSLKNSSSDAQETKRQSEKHCHSITVYSLSSCDVSIEDVATKNPLMKESDAQSLALENPQTPLKKVSQITKKSSENSWKSPTRSPFKCLFNSPSRLDRHCNDKSSLCNKQAKQGAVSLSAMTAKAEPLISPSKPLEFPNKIKRHLSTLQNDIPPDSTAPSKSLKNSEQENYKPYLNCLPPQLEKFPIPKCNKAPKSEKHACLSEQQKTIKSPVGNVCLNLSPPVLEKWDKLTTNRSPENSPEANHTVQVKRSFRSSSHKKSQSKRQRLVKLGEKWQVLSQQSVKKILFNDESPESFIGFHPQEIFKSDYSSDISFETVSEVLLTDHSDFEWTLGNSDGPFSEPSSQTAGGHRTSFSWDSVQEACPNHEVSVRHSPNTEKKSSPLTQIPEGGSTYTCSPTESVTRPKSTSVPNSSHLLNEDSLDKPETTSDQKLYGKSVKYPTDASLQHTSPISIPVQSFPTPLIQDIQFPTHLNFQNLDSVASSVYNFNTVETPFPSQVPPTSINNLSCTDIGCLPNSTAISTLQSFQIFSPVFSCEDSELPTMPSVSNQVQLPQHVADFKSQDQNISEDSHAAVDFQNLMPPTVTSINEQAFTTASPFQSNEAQLPLNSTATYDPLPVLNFESSFNLPVQNFNMLPNLVTAVEVNTSFSPLSTILTAPLTAETNFSPSISTELPLQSQCDSAQDVGADIEQISDTSAAVPDCLSDNEAHTQNVSNVDHQHPPVQVTELAASSSSSSSFFDSSASSELNPSLTSEQREVSPVIGFVSLSNFATSHIEDCGMSVRRGFRIQPSVLSHSTESSSKLAKSVTQKSKPSKKLCGFVTDCQDTKQTINSSSVPLVIQCDLLSDYKSSQYSSSCSSDPQVSNSTSTSKSESDTTDSLVKLAADNTEDAASDETVATSDWNALKNDSYADVKDSGFLSIEEITPKKSPMLTDSKSSEFSKKFSALAKPCSVVLEKTDLLLTGFSHKALDKQNIFSVKRANSTLSKTPEAVSKPRLLKRLSDRHKTFRLDYIPSGNTNRRLTPRMSTYKTRCK